MKKKTIIIVVAAALILAAATAITVYAYLQNTIQQPNTFTIGENEVSVTEAFTEPDVMRMNDTFDKVVYVCPDCHTVFKPKRKEAFFANHTPTLRKLTCTHCGYHGFCVETYGKEEK